MIVYSTDIHVYVFTGGWSNLDSELEVHGLSLVPIATNLIDSIWTDRPPRPNNPLLILDLEYSGLCSLRCK